MVAISKTAIAIASVVGLFSGAIAVPVEEDYVNTLITAPGLPTVSELGLTNADFRKAIADAEATMSVDSANDRDILKRAGPAFCWPFGRCKYQDALACAEYLGKIGDRDCEVRKEVVFCARNGCKWTGKVYKGDYTKSKCGDVRAAGGWVISACRDPKTADLSGTQVANGNENMAVIVSHP